jgi:hypothetical protein
MRNHTGCGKQSKEHYSQVAPVSGNKHVHLQIKLRLSICGL